MGGVNGGVRSPSPLVAFRVCPNSFELTSSPHSSHTCARSLLLLLLLVLPLLNFCLGPAAPATIFTLWHCRPHRPSSAPFCLAVCDERRLFFFQCGRKRKKGLIYIPLFLGVPKDRPPTVICVTLQCAHNILVLSN